MNKLLGLLKMIWTEMTRERTHFEKMEEEARRDGQLGWWD